MARPRKQTYPLETYLNNNKNGDISNNADTQRKPAWKAIINGLIVTILTDEYITPIILAEEENSQLSIVDGGSRTAAFMMFRYGNYRISASVEDSIIPYKKKERDGNGNIIWENATFDIKGKTYDQLPEELKKKFNGYQLDTVVHEHCDKKRIAAYIKRYNEHTSMNTNQKAFTYIDKFASKIHEIIDSKFFVDNRMYSDNDKNKGTIERVVVETIMCMNHFDNWKAQAKTACKYLNDYAKEEEFDVLIDNLHRLENVITDEIMDIFNKKDSFIFLTLFDKFTKVGANDIQFRDFLIEFKSNLRSSATNKNGQHFDEIDKGSGTKDKQVVYDKLEMLEDLMLEFLKVEEKPKNFGNVEEFIACNLDMDVNTISDDLDFYNESLDVLLEKTVKIDSKLRQEQNRPSLLAMMVYSYKEDVDIALEKWLGEYAIQNNMYFIDQRENFIHMKQEFEKYLKKCA